MEHTMIVTLWEKGYLLALLMLFVSVCSIVLLVRIHRLFWEVRLTAVNRDKFLEYRDDVMEILGQIYESARYFRWFGACLLGLTILFAWIVPSYGVYEFGIIGVSIIFLIVMTYETIQHERYWKKLHEVYREYLDYLNPQKGKIFYESEVR